MTDRDDGGPAFDFDLVPQEAVGLRLCKMFGDELRICKPVIFTRGRDAVVTVLNRAQVAGDIGPVGKTGSFWADFMSDECTWTETVALSREAWNALKNHWMRCKYEAHQ